MINNIGKAQWVTADLAGDMTKTRADPPDAVLSAAYDKGSVQILKKGDDIPCFWDSLFQWESSGSRYLGKEIDNPLCSPLSVAKGVLNELQPSVLGSKGFIGSGLGFFYGRQFAVRTQTEVIDGDSLTSDMYIAVYLIMDLSDPTSQKAYFKAYATEGQYHTEKDGDNLIQHESGVGKALVAHFIYASSAKTMTVDPIAVHMAVPGIADRTANLLPTSKIDGIGVSSLFDGSKVRSADHAGASLIDKRTFIVGNGFYRSYGPKWKLVTPNFMSTNLYHYDANNTVVYGRSDFSSPIPVRNLIGLRIMLGTETAKTDRTLPDTGVAIAGKTWLQEASDPAYWAGRTNVFYDSFVQSFSREYWLDSVPTAGNAVINFDFWMAINPLLGINHATNPPMGGDYCFADIESTRLQMNVFPQQEHLTDGYREPIWTGPLLQVNVKDDTHTGDCDFDINELKGGLGDVADMYRMASIQLNISDGFMRYAFCAAYSHYWSAPGASGWLWTETKTGYMKAGSWVDDNNSCFLIQPIYRTV